MAYTKNKTFLGEDFSSFEKGIESATIVYVEVLNEDGEIVDTAGTKPSGNTGILTVTHPDATPEMGMASHILSEVTGYAQAGYTATDAVIDPYVDLGCGVSLNGFYSVLADENIKIRDLYTSDISAPDADEIDDEYPYKTFEQTVNKKLATNYSKITKTANEILLEVKGVGANAWAANTNYLVGDIVSYNNSYYKCNTAHTSGSTFDSTKWTLLTTLSSLSTSVSSLSVSVGEISATVVEMQDDVDEAVTASASAVMTANAIQAKVTDAQGNYTVLNLKSDGLHIGDDSSTTTISGSSITVGTITASQISTGVIPTDVSDLNNDSGFIDGSDCTTIIGNTVTTNFVNALQITAQSIKGQVINLYGSDGSSVYGKIYAGTNTVGTTALEVIGQNGLRLVGGTTDDGKNVWVASHSGGQIIVGIPNPSASGNLSVSAVHAYGLMCESYFCMGSSYYGTSEPATALSSVTKYPGMLYFKYT